MIPPRGAAGVGVMPWSPLARGILAGSYGGGFDQGSTSRPGPGPGADREPLPGRDGLRHRGPGERGGHATGAPRRRWRSAGCWASPRSRRRWSACRASLSSTSSSQPVTSTSTRPTSPSSKRSIGPSITSCRSAPPERGVLGPRRGPALLLDVSDRRSTVNEQATAASAGAIVEALRQTEPSRSGAAAERPGGRLLLEAGLSRIVSPAAYGGDQASPRALVEAERTSPRAARLHPGS